MSGAVVNAPAGTPHRVFGPALQELLGNAEQRIEKIASRRFLVIALFTVVYAAVTSVVAASKPFWDDEFFTVYLSAGGWSEILRSLATGADQHPPSFYYLTHLISNLFGANHVTLRATSIFGFWLMCVCLYEIGSRIMSRPWGVVTMLLPCTVRSLYYYASEARGYGLMCGFTALAVLLWMMATGGERRRVTVPLTFLSLAAAVGSHYYAIFALVPLAGAELLRTIVRRRIDVPVWLALLGAFVPPAAFIGVIRSATGYSKHFWAQPSWNALLDVFPPSDFLVIALCAGGIVAYVKVRPADRGSETAAWVWTCLAGLAFVPWIVVVVAQFITHAYAARYTMTFYVGAFPVLAYASYRLARRRTVVAAALAALSIGYFGYNAQAWQKTFVGFVGQAKREHALLSKFGGDVAVAEVTVFHRLSFYGSIDLARKLTYLADPDAAIRHMGFDTIDRGLLDLNPWFPLNTRPYGAYVRAHETFGVYGYIGPWTWLTYELPSSGDLKFIERSGQRLLFSFVRDSSRANALPDGSWEGKMLFNDLAERQRPICHSYLKPESCFVLE